MRTLRFLPAALDANGDTKGAKTLEPGLERAIARSEIQAETSCLCVGAEP